ncbi:hypothetical protein BU055_02070 [Staphylococcus succinus]|uniref:hypothetical protein n=1 Tax=Staphylococcus succinus TaxID=61015 RepID=UPI000D1F3E74|nr:hypothetical protein [Staphylococcus succinus]PTJ85095.1 hypothetical protein BU055_02070 [Staphylococcus succinus]
MSGLTEFGGCIYKLTEMKLQHDQLKEENEQLKRKAQAYDKMMTGEMGELYKKAEAFDEVLAIHNMDEEYEDTIGDYEQYIDKLVKNYLEDE